MVALIAAVSSSGSISNGSGRKCSDSSSIVIVAVVIVTVVIVTVVIVTVVIVTVSDSNSSDSMFCWIVSDCCLSKDFDRSEVDFSEQNSRF